MRLSIDHKIGFGFAAALLTLAVVGFIACRSTQQAIDQEADVADSQQDLRVLEEIVSALKDAETGERGYALTGQKSYLAPYEVGVFELLHKRDYVLLAQNDVYKSMDAKLAFMRSVIEARKTRGFEAAQRLIATGRGERLMQQIRDGIQNERFNVQTLSNQRLATAQETDGKTFVIILSGYALAFAVVLVSYLSVRLYLTERRRTEAALRVSEERFRTAIGSMQEGLLLRDAVHGMQLCNRSAETLLGLTMGQIGGAERRDLAWHAIREDGSLFPEQELPTS